MADSGGVWVKVYPDPDGGAPGAAVISGHNGATVETGKVIGDKTYDIYTFTDDTATNLSLTVETAGLADVLLVGGGGGSGGIAGAGGGGVNLLTGVYLPQASMQVVVGNGGAGDQTGSLWTAQTGGISHISPTPVTSLLLNSPGGAASFNTQPTGVGAFGASGAGAGSNNTHSATGGPGIPGLGNKGGDMVNSGGAGGGGGGAGGAGADSTSLTFAGDGGPARIVTITGQEIHVGGGGGGGSDSIGRNGVGGEGAGDGGHYTTNPTPCTPNRGGGAGGIRLASGTWGPGSPGGSGIVIVRVEI